MISLADCLRHGTTLCGAEPSSSIVIDPQNHLTKIDCFSFNLPNSAVFLIMHVICLTNSEYVRG